jgi:regulatory protein
VAFSSRSSFERPASSATGRSRGGRDREPPVDVPPEPEADPEQVARQICLHQLEYAPRTRAELAAVLAKRGVADEVAHTVLGRFTEVGMIDDALFSQMWVTSRHRGKGLAGRALAQELRRKGVDDEVAREAVATIDPLQEAETARDLVRRKLPSTRGLTPEARVRRLAGQLARKGYGAGLAFRIVKEELEAEGVETTSLILDTDGLSALE